MSIRLFCAASLMACSALTLLAVEPSTLAAAPNAQPFDHPLVFEPNHGQAPAQVQWIARGSGYQLFLTINGGRPWRSVAGLEPTGGTSNYFIGDDPKGWHTGIPHYARLSAPDVYNGIDLVFYSHET